MHKSGQKIKHVMKASQKGAAESPKETKSEALVKQVRGSGVENKQPTTSSPSTATSNLSRNPAIAKALGEPSQKTPAPRPLHASNSPAAPALSRTSLGASISSQQPGKAPHSAPRPVVPSPRVVAPTVKPNPGTPQAGPSSQSSKGSTPSQAHPASVTPKQPPGNPSQVAHQRSMQNLAKEKKEEGGSLLTRLLNIPSTADASSTPKAPPVQKPVATDATGTDRLLRLAIAATTEINGASLAGSLVLPRDASNGALPGPSRPSKVPTKAALKAFSNPETDVSKTIPQSELIAIASTFNVANVKTPVATAAPAPVHHLEMTAQTPLAINVTSTTPGAPKPSSAPSTLVAAPAPPVVPVQASINHIEKLTALATQNMVETAPTPASDSRKRGLKKGAGGEMEAKKQKASYGSMPVDDRNIASTSTAPKRCQPATSEAPAAPSTSNFPRPVANPHPGAANVAAAHLFFNQFQFRNPAPGGVPTDAQSALAQQLMQSFLASFQRQPMYQQPAIQAPPAQQAPAQIEQPRRLALGPAPAPAIPVATDEVVVAEHEETEEVQMEDQNAEEPPTEASMTLETSMVEKPVVEVEEAPKSSAAQQVKEEPVQSQEEAMEILLREKVEASRASRPVSYLLGSLITDKLVSTEFQDKKQFEKLKKELFEVLVNNRCV